MQAFVSYIFPNWASRLFYLFFFCPIFFFANGYNIDRENVVRSKESGRYKSTGFYLFWCLHRFLNITIMIYLQTNLLRSTWIRMISRVTSVTMYAEQLTIEEIKKTISKQFEQLT